MNPSEQRESEVAAICRHLAAYDPASRSTRLHKETERWVRSTISSAEKRGAKSVSEELIACLEAALEWIDAVPSEARAEFPTMPGFCRDWVDTTLENAKKRLKG